MVARGAPTDSTGGSAQPPKFAALLRRFRLAADLTQEELAERAGISARAVSDLERGVNRFPRKDTTELLVDALALGSADRAEFLAAARRRAAPPATPEQRQPLPAPTNLPNPPTTFVGRERDRAAVDALIQREDVRLLTLTGPAGVGKTRLAVQAARDLSPWFADGVYFVDFSALSDPGYVIPTIAHALGLQESGSEALWQALTARLAEKHLLLLLDNFEQVVAAASDVADLLTGCGAFKVIATSRERLRLRAERQYAVAPLQAPDAGRRLSPAQLAAVESVELFRDRAQAVLPDFTLNDENAAAIGQICRQLDGLPLAIELAAARIDALPPAAMLPLLTRRLDVLAAGLRDLPARQQSLRSAIEWSYSLLASDEQALFRVLAIFAGGGAIEAANAVAHDPGEIGLDAVRGIEALAGKSLIERETGAGGQTRFRLLEAIREFGCAQADRHGETGRLQANHAAFYRALAEEAESGLIGSGQRVWLDRLEIDRDNLRAALSWALDHGASELGLRLAAALWRFWDIRGYLSEGRDWLERALAHADGAPSVLRAKALTAAASIADSQGDYDCAIERYQTAIPLWREAGDRLGLARALNNLGLVLDSRGEYAPAVLLYEEALAIFRALDDRFRVGIALNNLGVVAKERGDYSRAAELFAESLALRREVGDQQGIAATLGNLANVASAQGDHEREKSLQEEALAISRAVGSRGGMASAMLNLGVLLVRQGKLDDAAKLYWEALALRQALGDKASVALLLNNLGGLALAQGDVDQAVSLCRDGLELREKIGDKIGIAYSLEQIAAIAATCGQSERAAALMGAVDAMLENAEHIAPPADRAEHETVVSAVRDSLGESAMLTATERGRWMTLDAVIALATDVRPEAANSSQTHVAQRTARPATD